MYFSEENEEETEELLSQVHRVSESMEFLRKSLLEQQNYVKKLIEETHAESQDSTPNNSIVMSSIPPEESTKKCLRICPMCETNFPPISYTHEDFVSHVNSHFTFEEADTLQNYEVVDENDSSMYA